ncbi:MAG: hypothetical protein IT373_19605 [Polyangiaceae bacterium]|nr:hypothetical protein [Polyangiaceae bacterium]
MPDPSSRALAPSRALPLLVAPLLLGCPPVTPETELGYVPPAFQCTAVNVARWRAAAPLPPAAPAEVPPAAGHMTEAAAQAKRLFDGERWPEAGAALEAVARGDHGDDEGNRQLAEYYLAIALYRQSRTRESAERFAAIARRPGHLKHAETLLWLGKLAAKPDSAAFLAPRDFTTYTAPDVERFRNAHQMSLWYQLSYLVAIGGLSEGGRDDVAELLRASARGGPFADAARSCLGAYGVR